MIIEPLSGEDSTVMYLRGFICSNCEVVHWAYNPNEEGAFVPSEIKD